MPNNDGVVLITGASGFLGSYLVAYFSAKGWKVRALVRNPHKQAAIPNVEYVAYDLTLTLDTAIFAGATHLIHAAYIKYSNQQSDAYALNLQGATELAKAARENGLKKSVFVSTTSAHEDAVSIYGKQKLATEKLFTGTDFAVVRFNLIIGNGGIVKEMSDFMRTKHIVPLVGGGMQPLQVIAIADVAKTLETVLTTDFSDLYTVASREVYTYKGFYTLLAKHFKVKVLFVPLSFSLLLTIIRLASHLHVPLPVSADNVLGLKKLHAVDTEPDLKTLGITLRPLDQALNESGL